MIQIPAHWTPESFRFLCRQIPDKLLLEVQRLLDAGQVGTAQDCILQELECTKEDALSICQAIDYGDHSNGHGFGA